MEDEADKLFDDCEDDKADEIMDLIDKIKAGKAKCPKCAKEGTYVLIFHLFLTTKLWLERLTAFFTENASNNELNKAIKEKDQSTDFFFVFVVAF